MQNVLIVAPEPNEGPVAQLMPVLRKASYHTVWTSLDGRSSDNMTLLCRAFGGRPPDILITDLTKAFDFLPLRNARRLLMQAWGEEMPSPISIALVELRHLESTDWPAFADDFLLPSFKQEEFSARLKLLLFRHRHLHNKDILTCADIILDLAGNIATNSFGNQITLTSKEFLLLRFLCTHRGKFFSRDQLLDLVWGIDYDGGDRTVDIHISRLRTKLPPGIISILETRRGVGYGLISGEPIKAAQSSGVLKLANARAI